MNEIEDALFLEVPFPGGPEDVTNKFTSRRIDQKCVNHHCVNRFGEGPFEVINFLISAKNMKGLTLVMCGPCAKNLKDVINGND